MQSDGVTNSRPQDKREKFDYKLRQALKKVDGYGKLRHF